MKTENRAQSTMLAIKNLPSGDDAPQTPRASAPRYRVWAMLFLTLTLLTAAFAELRAADDITIKGRVFYNDNRTMGHFDRRLSPAGIVGKEGDHAVPNWLAAYRWTVEILELDKSEPQGSRGCTKSQVVTSVGVDSDGEFSATIKANDKCGYNVGQVLDLQLRVKMHNCFNDWCISFRDGDGDIYSMDLAGATYARPLRAVAGDVHDLGDHYYPARDGANNSATIKGVASNYWASVIDAAIFLHEERDIPFFDDEFGALSYYYPSSESATATAQSPQKVAVSPYKFVGGYPAWIGGRTPVHEYGHILMQRAWGGGYGFPGTGRSADDYVRAKSPASQVAFKEAWAEFVARVVFADDLGCEGENFDLNNLATFDKLKRDKKKDELLLLSDSRRKELKIMGSAARKEEGFEVFGPILAPWHQGTEYRYNNLKFLCDFHDSTPKPNVVAGSPSVGRRTPGSKPGSNPPRTIGGTLPRPGTGKTVGAAFEEPRQYPDTARREDRVKVGFVEMWTILRGMFLRHLEYGGRFVDPGLYVCDWADYYVNLLNSEEEVGSETHEEIAAKVLDIAKLNNVTCSGVFGVGATPVQ